MPLRYVDGRNPASFNSRPDPPCADAAGVGLDVLSRKVMEALQSYVRLLRIVIQFVDVHLKHESGIFGNMRCREGYALMAGDDPCLSGPDESSQTGTAFPETGTSLEAPQNCSRLNQIGSGVISRRTLLGSI